MILYYDGVSTTINASGLVGTNLYDVQSAIIDLMTLYNKNRETGKPAITDIKYNDKTPEIKICMSDGSAYRLPFHGLQAKELWNSTKNAILFLSHEMGRIKDYE